MPLRGRVNMVHHGFRCATKSSGVGGFACHVCGAKKQAGEMVVAFKNDNKSGRNAWDHVCDGDCAERYKSPALVTTLRQRARSSVGSALSSAMKTIKQKVGAAADDPDADFFRRAASLEFSREGAADVLAEHGGDRVAAVATMSSLFAESFAHDLDAEADAAPQAAQRCSPCELDDESDEDSLPPPPPVMPTFSSVEARLAIHDVFMTFIKPIIPKAQSDGSFRDGDAELLDSLMTTPLTLALPRAERLADLLKPQSGWNEAGLQRTRSFFALSAAGVQFLLFLPTITHRQQSMASMVRNPSESKRLYNICLP